jgi:long-chain fatty acid transport protein
VLIALALLTAGVLAGGLDGLGVGSRATGMGGAFRAVANDWTAAFYNPAGYANAYDNQLGGNMSFVYFRNEITPNFRWGGDSESGMMNDVAGYNRHEILSLPSAGFIVRLPVWGETVFGLSAYQPFDYNVSWTLYDPMPAYNDVLSTPVDQYRNNLDVVAFQLTAAREFKEDKFSLGLGLAVLRADLYHNSMYFRTNPYLSIDPDWDGADRPFDNIVSWAKDDGYGWGFGLRGGMMFNATEKLTLGASFFYPTSITTSGNTVVEYYLPKIHQTNHDGDDPGGVEALLKSGSMVLDSAEFEAELNLPSSFGGGLAYQVSEKLLVSVDAEYTLWSQFKGYSFKYSNHTLTASPIFTRAMNDTSLASATINSFFTSDLSQPVEWKDAVKFALGLAYDYSSVLTLLAGGSMDQSPSTDNEYFTPLFMDLGTKYGLSGGLMVHIQQWDIGLVTSYLNHPDVNDVALVDIDGDGSMDTFAGDFKAATYNTSLSFNYRF